MDSSDEYIRWRLSGSLPGFGKPLLPNIPISVFHLENSCYYRPPRRYSAIYRATSITVQGELLASTLFNGKIIFQNKKTLDRHRYFRAHVTTINDLKWQQTNSNGSASNGWNFVTASADGSMAYWDAEVVKKVRHYEEAHSASVKTVAFHDPNIFASGGRDGFVKLWDLRTPGWGTNQTPEFSAGQAHSAYTPSKLESLTSKAETRNGDKAVKAYHRPLELPKRTRYSGLYGSIDSHAVTSVCFKPAFSPYLYTAGLSDNLIKLWDIRQSRKKSRIASGSRAVRRGFTCSLVHSIQNYHDDPGNFGHGFQQLEAVNVSGLGNVLLAYSTDNRIYCFAKDELDPVAALIGTSNRNFTFSHTIQSFNLGGKSIYLLAGSPEGRVYAWDLYQVADKIFNSERESNIVPAHLPTYYFPVGTQREAVQCVAVDEAASRFYNTVDNELYQWSVCESKIEEEEVFANYGGRLPRAETYYHPKGESLAKDIVPKSAKRPTKQASMLQFFKKRKN